MTKPKLFIATGALLLGVSAIFATKVNNQFARVLTAAANSGNYLFEINTPTISFLTTCSGTGVRNIYVQLVTNNGHKLGNSSYMFTIWTRHPIYYK